MNDQPKRTLLERIHEADSIITSVLAELREKNRQKGVDAFTHERPDIRREMRSIEQAERDCAKLLADLRIVARYKV